MRTLFLIALLACLPIVAASQPDWGVDQLGVYSDEGALSHGYCGVAANVPIPVYFIITFPAAPVQGIEFSYELTGDIGTVLRLERQLALPDWEASDDADPTRGNYRLMGSAPLPLMTHHVLVSWTLMFSAATSDGYIYLRGLPEPSLPGNLPVVDGGAGYGLRRVGVSSGDPDQWVATTGCPPLAEESHSFGAVKSLFR
jgi:hypothetical protein